MVAGLRDFRRTGMAGRRFKNLPLNTPGPPPPGFRICPWPKPAN